MSGCIERHKTYASALDVATGGYRAAESTYCDVNVLKTLEKRRGDSLMHLLGTPYSSDDPELESSQLAQL